MRFGILQRYVVGQVLRAFALALLTLTGVIVLFMVMAEATRLGLPPQDVVRLVPFVIPGIMPYTVPVALLFAVSVVYGRLASDNEVVAVKACGCSAWTLLWPSLAAGLALSAALAALSGEVVPRSNHRFKKAVFMNMEDTFYWFLKRQKQFDPPGWDFFVGVRDVTPDRLLVDATIKHRAKGASRDSYDLVVQASRARIRFLTDRKPPMIEITLANALMHDTQGNQIRVPRNTFEYPLPDGNRLSLVKKFQEMTFGEIAREKTKRFRQMDEEPRRQAIAAALWIGSGRVDRVDWKEVRATALNRSRWAREVNELDTEKNVRIALAASSFFFALLGAPVGILFARRDFLSAFISCFLPIIILYYPLVLVGVNLGRDGQAWPQFVWSGNLVLGLLAGFFALPPVLKH